MAPNDDLAGPESLSGRISSWRDFGARVEAAMAMAAVQPCDLVMMDADFGRWPIGQRSVMEAFHQWALNARASQCSLLACCLDELPRCHPRWLMWRQAWAHRVHCLQIPEDLASQAMPLFIIPDVVGLRLLEPLHGTGIWTRDPRTLVAWMREVDAILQRSQEALPPTTLGL